MSHRTLYLSFFLMLTCILTAFGGKMKKELIGKNVGVIGITCNKSIDAGEFSGSTAAMITKLAKNEAFDLSDVPPKLRDKLFGDLKKGLPFDLMEESSVIGQEKYKALFNDEEIMKNTSWLLSPEGYIAINPMRTKKVEQVLKGIDNVEYGLIMGVDYKLNKKRELMGFGTANVYATIFLRVFAIKDGKLEKLFSTLKGAGSDGTFKFKLGGLFKPEEIKPLCTDATDKALAEVQKYISKKLKKMNK